LAGILDRLKRASKKEGGNKMTEKEQQQQLLTGLGIWKLELGRGAKERKPIFRSRARPGFLAGIVDRLKRPR
jgi:hypothetical protein